MSAKKVILLFLILFRSIAFAQEVEPKSTYPKNEVYFSVGLPTNVDLFLCFLSYMPSRDEYFDGYARPKLPNIEVGYNRYIFKWLSIGIGCNNDFIESITVDKESRGRIQTEYGNMFTVIANLCVLIPTKTCIPYLKYGYGLTFEFCPGFPGIMPSVQLCPFGVKFPLKDDYKIFTEFNLGFNSLFCVGLTKGF